MTWANEKIFIFLAEFSFHLGFIMKIILWIVGIIFLIGLLVVSGVFSLIF